MTLSAALAALSDRAFVVDASRRGRVGLRGADARAFVHRLSTNHVSELAKGQGRLNAFPTDKGRLVDLVLHLDRGDDGIVLVTSAGRGPAVHAWLDRYLFSEKVELLDLSATGSAAEIAGRGAPSIVEAVVPGAAALPAWGFAEADGRIAARGFDRVDATGAHVPAFVVVDLARPGIAALLVDNGAVSGSDDDAEVARVAAGVPGESGELVDKHNPLDLGLHDAIHWAKGCYIGQEVIARLDTYQKQSRRLVGLILDDAGRSHLAAGAQVLLDGAAVGEVTSVAPGALGLQPSALAVAKLRDMSTPVAVQLKAGDVVIDALATMLATAQQPHA